MGIIGMTVVVLFNTFPSIEWVEWRYFYNLEGSVRATDSWESLSEIVSNRAEIHFILNKQHERNSVKKNRNGKLSLKAPSNGITFNNF